MFPLLFLFSGQTCRICIGIAQPCSTLHHVTGASQAGVLMFFCCTSRRKIRTNIDFVEAKSGELSRCLLVVVIAAVCVTRGRLITDLRKDTWTRHTTRNRLRESCHGCLLSLLENGSTRAYRGPFYNRALVLDPAESRLTADRRLSRHERAIRTTAHCTSFPQRPLSLFTGNVPRRSNSGTPLA